MALLRDGQARLRGAGRAHLLRGADCSSPCWRRCSCPSDCRTSLSARSSRAASGSRSSRTPETTVRRSDGSRWPAGSDRRSLRRAARPLEAAPPRGAPPLTVAFWDCLVGSIVIAPALLLVGGASRPTRRSGVLCSSSALSSRASQRSPTLALLRHVTAQAAGILTFLEPVSAVVLAWALLDESLPRKAIVGAALVLRRRDRRRRCSSRPTAMSARPSPGVGSSDP